MITQIVGYIKEIVVQCGSRMAIQEGGREGGSEGGRERGREGEREGERDREREREREIGRVRICLVIETGTYLCGDGDMNNSDFFTRSTFELKTTLPKTRYCKQWR